MTKLLLTAVVVAIGLAGCATYSDWQPVVDSQNDPNAAMIPVDQEDCRQLAQQAGSPASEAAKGAVAGGLIGAATGAAVGAVFGSPGTGAAVGAASGGISGATQTGVSGDEQYRRAFINCMRNRGHNVIN